MSAYLALRLFHPDVDSRFVQQTGLPLPLYGKVARRALDDAALADVSRVLRDSIKYAFDHRDEALEYASRFAGGLESDSLKGYIGTYVGRDAIDVGNHGRLTVREFLERDHRAGLLGTVSRELFSC
jgi:1,4-dihydroxy-6-naphthoate synthase